MDMSNLRKQAGFGLVFWTLGAALFLVLFFSGGGPNSFGEDSSRVALTSLAYGIGFLTHLFLMWKFRSRKIGENTVKDEWDDEVAQKANGVALIVLLLFVYLTGVALWEVYRDSLLVPAGWVWFMAYFSIIVGLIAHATAMLCIDSGRGSDA